MKKYIFILLCALFTTSLAQDFKCDGVTYTSTTKSSTNWSVTPYKYEDKDGKVYPILINNNGRCAIEKVSGPSSKNPGKKYKKYLSEDICKDICHKTNHTYKPKKK